MPDLHDLLDGLRGAYDTYGYPLVFVGALLENTILLGLFLPGGTLVLLGAVYAQQGRMALAGVLLLGWMGTVAGTSLDYALGRWGLQPALGNTGLMRKLQPGLDEAGRFIARYGPWAFLLAHFIGHVRSFVAITAGTTNLPYSRFLLYEGAAALVWNLLFVGTGYFLGRNIEQLQQLLSRGGLAILFVVAAAYVGYRLLRRRRQSATKAHSRPR
jgi:membrane protein DedA with SNARE-associated domain